MTAKIAEYVCIVIGVVFFTSDTFKYMVDDWRYAEPACQYVAKPQADGTLKLYRC